MTQQMRKLGCAILAGVLACGSTALAATLEQIPLPTSRTDGGTAGGTPTATEGRSIVITPSGTPVVSGLAAGAQFPGMIWTPANGSRQLVTIPAGFSTAPGLAYRMVAGSPQLMVHGLSSGWHTVSLSNDHGVTWALGWRVTNEAGVVSPQIGTTGTLAANGLDDVFYAAWWDNNSGHFLLKTDRYSGSPLALQRESKDSPETASLQGQSATGLGVGRRRVGGTNYSTYVVQHTGSGGTQPAGTLNGLAGNTRGEAWAVSADGTRIVGVSPVSDGRTGNWPYLMTVVPSPTAIPTQTSIVELPVYPDFDPAVAAKGQPYGISREGGFVVGSSYRNVERAVIWDVRDANPANWKVHDLTDHFEAIGQLAGFQRLARAFGVVVANDTVWVTGWGALAGTGAQRGFVLSIPVSDFPLPPVGACCQVGDCSSKLQPDCAAIPGAIFKLNTTCLNAACPGACCDPMTGTCGEFVEQATCLAGGGTFRGFSTECATSSCFGSCCKTDGTCGLEPPGACTAANGLAGALGSTCGANTCIGACCQGQKGCADGVAYGTCPQADFKGVGSVCEQQDCPCSSSVNVWADTDVDGDVDMDDFGQFQRCFAGTDNVVGAGCECLNHVNDGTIDGADFIEFMNCATGAEVAWSPGVTPLCVP